MADEPVVLVEKAVRDADALLRRRFKKIDADHLAFAIAPDGTAVIRSNCGPKMLREIARMLDEIADEYTPPPTEERH